MEASALQHQATLPALAGKSPLLRLQSDEKLVAMVRRGQNGAFEALVHRYQARLLAFCRHMLGSQEDAEDVLQEVFAASYNALLGDNRPINARPWLYRIARNRCLNHLRKPRPAGQDSMDIFERDGGATTADTVHRREEFRQIVSDVQELPETQRTALLLREIDALSYDQISEAMDTTVPSVKSLLVRARVNLAEASEARLLTCEEARLELGQVAEGLAKSSPPVRRHLKSCERCRIFKRELNTTTKALAAIFPIGPLAIVLHKFGLAKLGLGGGAAAAGGAAATSGGGLAAGGAGIAAGAGVTAASGAAGGAISAGIGTIASKAAAGMAAAAIVTAGAVEVKHVTKRDPAATTAAAVQAPVVTGGQAAPAKAETKPEKVKVAKAEPKPTPAPPAPAAVAPVPVPVTPPAPPPPVVPVQEEEATTTLPPRTEPVTTPPPSDPGTAPGEPTGSPEQPPAPPAGEPKPAPGPQPPPPPPPAP